MGAYALGAASYAAKAAGLAAPDRPEASVKHEISWQLAHMSAGGPGRPANPPARRREPVRPPRAGAPRIRPTRHDHP
ncbi:MAG: hypothetical protein ACRDVP_01065 [Acidimicrobiales bacterium]